MQIMSDLELAHRILFNAADLKLSASRNTINSFDPPQTCDNLKRIKGAHHGHAWSEPYILSLPITVL